MGKELSDHSSFLYLHNGRGLLHPAPVFLPGKSHGWRSLVGCSPWGLEEPDTTKQLHFHFSLSCTGEGNGNPLQCSCLENPRDGGAWWAAVYQVAQSRTRLMRLSSSSSRRGLLMGFPGGASGKGPACQCRKHKRCGFDPWVGKIPWRRAWQPTPVLMPRESQDRGALQAMVHRVAKSQIRLKQLSTHAQRTFKRQIKVRNEKDAHQC